MYKNKVVLVTGGGSGIGEALCHNLANQGARVYVVGIQADQVESVSSEINKTGQVAFPACFDVTDYEAYSRFISEVMEKEGQIDFLFNNAGITLISELKDTPIERCRETLDTNLMGVINGIHITYPLMAEQRCGHIINTASLAGILGYPTSAIYAASKAAVLNLSNSLRYEAKHFGVKVSAVCPGYVDTGIFRQERILGASVDSIIEGLPFKMISADQAAKEILQGVQKNKGVIIFPFYAKAVAFLGAICPALLKNKYEEVISSFRADTKSSSN